MFKWLPRRFLFACSIALLVPCTAWAASSYSATRIPVKATIADLQALGVFSSQTPTVYAKDYSQMGAGGGGVFVWEPTNVSTPDTCLVFQATAVATGRWVRQLNGQKFTVDMCGAIASPQVGPNNTAFNTALALCGSSRLPLFVPAKTYYLSATLVVPPACSFFGAGGGAQNTGNTILSWSGSGALSYAMTIIGPGTPGTDYLVGGSVGGFIVIGNALNSIPVGIYVSRVSRESLSDISVSQFTGTGLLFGNTIGGAIDNIFTSQTGTALRAPVEIDGEASGTYGGSTLTVNRLDIEAPNAGTLCGLKIDRYYTVAIYGGFSEGGAATGICVQSQAANTISKAVVDLSINGFDVEGETADCMEIGYGWTGTAGFGVQGFSLTNSTCGGGTAGGIRAENTSAFYANNNYVTSDPAGTTYDYYFEGTNFAASIPRTAVVPNNKYIFFNGAEQVGAAAGIPWDSNINAPITVASLPACSNTYLNQLRTTSDESGGTYNSFYSTATGGSTHKSIVKCDGTNWVVIG